MIKSLVKHPIKSEPVWFFTVLHLGFNSVQFFAIPMANWMHGTILFLASVTGAFATRRKVTPAEVIEQASEALSG